MSKYYYHGMGDPYGYVPIKKFLSILKTGEIQCKRLLGYPNSFEYTCNGMDYVSVCKKMEQPFPRIYEDAFESYVQNCFCFIISDEIRAMKTISIPVFCWSDVEVIKNLEEETQKRYSDMHDEWQVWEKIPLTFIIGVGIPLKELEIRDWRDFPESLERLKQILFICQSLGLDIVDSSEPDFVEKYEDSKESSLDYPFLLKKFQE